MPERRGELELSLQPMVERPSFRLALLLPDEIGAHRYFIFGCFRTSVEHMQFLHFHRPLRLRHIVDRLSISTFQNLAKIDRQLFLSGRSPESDGKLFGCNAPPRVVLVNHFRKSALRGGSSGSLTKIVSA